jgi:hypothetical protein
MKRLNFISMLCLVAWLGGCAGSQVTVDQDDNADLSKYRTFDFADADSRNENAGDNGNPVYQSSLIEKNIHTYIADELQSRGVKKVETNADMLVAYHTYTEKKRGTTNDYYPMMYGGWGWRYYPWGVTSFPYGYTPRRTYTYTEGTLIIDIVDARTNQLVWRGSVAGTVDSPANVGRQVEKAVRTIFKKYPVSPGAAPDKTLSRR